MEGTCVELNDLADEIILIILQKLDNLDVLYSFHAVNRRLNKIIRDPIFTSSLNFVKWSSNKFLNKFSNVILHRFCLQILPDISMKIKWFHLESSSVKHILRAADYPNLYGLGLYNMKEKTARRLFTDESLSSGIFKKQITRLIITIDRNKKNDLLTMVKMCSRIFSVFINLTHLMFSESAYEDIVRLLFNVPSRSFSSSSLLVLNIKVQSVSQCLYLLDGRFSQLHTLYVDLVNTSFPIEQIENKEKIPNLKCFVLSCAWETSRYNELILPLLYRMSNLEKLGLYLTVYVNEAFIDGNHLKKNIFNYMPYLNAFAFDIRSLMFINDQMNLPSKEDIQRTFTDFKYTKIISYVDYFLEEKLGQCHVYSYPFEMQYYQKITNHFPGGLYQHVRIVSLHDEHPFEHEFFIRISQSFPYMQKLSLINRQPQKHKQSYKSINHNHNSSIVEYNYLMTLNIGEVHDDYVEEFLFNTKTYFHNNIRLYINYKSLERVTYNFTRDDDTRVNCAKINEIYLFGEKCSKSLRDYFPCAIIH